MLSRHASMRARRQPNCILMKHARAIHCTYHGTHPFPRVSATTKKSELMFQLGLCACNTRVNIVIAASAQRYAHTKHPNTTQELGAWNGVGLPMRKSATDPRVWEIDVVSDDGSLGQTQPFCQVHPILIQSNREERANIFVKLQPPMIIVSFSATHSF